MQNECEIPCIKIYAQNDTFVSSYYPDGNYINLDYLLVGMSLEDPYQYTSTLMDFDISPLLYNKLNISYARLNLFVTSIEFNSVSFDILLNPSDYDPSTVTWNTRPCPDEIITPVSITKSDLNKYIEIDISTAIKKYLCYNSSILGLNLIMSNPLGGVAFGSSRNFKKPFLEIAFSNKENGKITDEPDNIDAIHCMIPPKNVVNNLSPLIFDKENIHSEDTLHFDSSTGYFNIYSQGNYILKWSASIKTADSVDILSLSILDNTGNTISSISTSPNTPIVIYGSTLLNITKNKYQFTIINTSGNRLILDSDSYKKLSLELIKI